MAPEVGLGCCQPHSVEWHSSRSDAGGAVFLSGRSVERRSDWPFSVAFCSGGCARAHPPGVAPKASEEWFNSFEVLARFVMLRPVRWFPHANWP
jgi:hypothetical protein